MEKIKYIVSYDCEEQDHHSGSYYWSRTTDSYSDLKSARKEYKKK